MSQNPYPVVDERPLDPAVRGWLGRSRNLRDLPRHIPGTIPVFEVRDGYLAFNERRHLGKREDLVVNAISVSVVDLRPRTVTVHVAVPSSSAADEFTVLVDFRCEVRDPEVVAASGLRDLVEPLRQYLRRDIGLTQLGVKYSVADINVVRDELSRRVDAYVRLRAPHVDGMVVELAGVRVPNPKDLAVHERDKRNVNWRLETAAIEHAGEDRNATRLRQYVEGGPDSLAALAAARNELDLNRAVDRGYHDVEKKRQQAIEFLKSMPEEQWHTIAVDTQSIVSALTNELFGRQNKPELTETRGAGDQLDA
jgi:hypothetical protein